MIHHRIIASVFFLLGAIGLAITAFEDMRMLRLGRSLGSDGATLTFIFLGLCAFTTATAIGLFRSRRWARITAQIAAVLLGLYCLSFIEMAGLSFGIVPFAAGWLGVAFVVYTITVFCIHVA
jgi:predicted small integral membrane protein